MRAFVNPFFISRIVNRVALSSSKRKPVSDRHLDASILEDRVLYSVTPLDTSALVGDLDGIDPEMFDQPTFDACDADDVFSIDEAVDTGRNGEPPTSANGLLEVELLDTDQHLETVDLYGNEYHAMTDLPTLEVDVTYDSTDLLSALDGPAPLTDTFLLHSNPGAAHTIYLDFNGHVTSGTSWNGSFNGGADITTAAYDFDGNTASFSDAELERIQYIWQRVSEDFSPFDVNVTTEAPTLDALIKSGSGDTDWGVRVVIGGSSSDWYGASAGGVAYYNSFNWNTDTPVFVFEAQLGNGAEKYTAEAVSHEVGHSLGLAHDGTS
ncbi:MAG: hypothetical protein KDA60_12400, partial [Planctomycetales bacterium]|nr:hypothetical protein [Planctomycetales bacterium]